MSKKYALVKVYEGEVKPLLEILDLGRRANSMGHKDVVEWHRQVAAKFRRRLARGEVISQEGIIKEVAGHWACYIEERDLLGPQLTECLGIELQGMLKVTDRLGIGRQEIVKYRLDNFGA